MGGNSQRLGMDYEPKGRIGLGAAGASPMFNEVAITGKNIRAVKSADKMAVTWGKVKQPYD